MAGKDIEGPFSPHPEGCVLRVHAQPGARRTEWAGVHGEALKLRVKAPPVEGKANQAILEFLADYFHARRADIELLAGAASREKRFLLRGISPESVAASMRENGNDGRPGKNGKDAKNGKSPIPAP